MLPEATEHFGTRTMLPMRRFAKRSNEPLENMMNSCLTLVKKRKLRWIGHVSKSSGLAILQGTVKGKRRRGRQKKRWEDSMKEWTGRRLFCFGSLVTLDVARCYLWLFTLYINVKIGKNSC